MALDTLDIPAFLLRGGKAAGVPLDDATRAYQPWLGSWAIEIALALGWARPQDKGRPPGIFEDADFLRVTGLPPLEDDEDDDSPQRVRRRGGAFYERRLRKRLAQLKAQGIAKDLPLFTNLALLAQVLGLSLGEQVLLAFAVACDAFPAFKCALSPFTAPTSTPDLCRLLSRISGLPLPALQRAAEADSPLLSSGLVRLDHTVRDLDSKLDVIDGLSGIMLTSHDSAERLIARFVRPVAEGSLTLADFPHLHRDAEVLTAYLRQSLAAGASGVNVLLYGPPGVGKTEFVQALAATLGIQLYEIGFADDDGDPICGAARLRAYSFCQRLLARRRNALLMFDEIEDVFQAGDSPIALFDGGGRCRTAGKAWINRALENNPVPALWISNSVDHIDPAYLRRFDYSVEFPIPPQRVRQNIVRHYLGELAPSPEWLAALAANDRLTPAQLQRAARVARLVGAGDPQRAIAVVEQTLQRSAQLLQQPRPLAHSRRPTAYDPSLINADVDPSRLLVGLRRRPQASLCFYGPPGTGKSELARYLAEELDKPLLVRRASDLLSMWVGGTEKNIAAMFAAARTEDAVLLLDEADSFLADRLGAHNAWEVTQVNELLTQMEAFDGIFICTTNLIERLDSASLRRFTFKVRFDYLAPAQRWAMFRQELARLGGDLGQAAAWESRVRGLDRLTPGDFAVAVRQFALADEPPTAEALFQSLEAECRLKRGGAGRIGFVW